MYHLKRNKGSLSSKFKKTFIGLCFLIVSLGIQAQESYLQHLPNIYDWRRPGIPAIGQIGVPGAFFTPDWSVVQTPETIKPTFDYWFNYEASDPNYLGRIDLSVKTHNASLMYYEAYIIDAAIDAWMALGDTQYLDKALGFVEDRLATQYDYATRAALSLNAVEDDVPRMGWVGANVSEAGVVTYPGEEVQAENQWMMAVARMLYYMHIVPSVNASDEYKPIYNSILKSTEEFYKKWYFRTTPGGRNFYALGNQHDLWERVLASMMFVRELTSDQEVIDLIDDVTTIMEVDGFTISGVYRRLKTQLLTATHPVTGGIFWEDEWGNYSTAGLGDDISHGNLAMSYIPEAVKLGKNDWNMTHLEGMRELWDYIYDENTGYTRRNINSPTTTSTNFTAYWLNLAQQFGPDDTASEAIALAAQKLRPWISNYYAPHYAKIMLANATNLYEPGTGQPFEETIGALWGEYNIDNEKPSVKILAPLKESTSAINNTSIVVTDNSGILPANVSVDPSSTVTTSSFVCSSINANQVECTLVVTSSGELSITATDNAANTTTNTEFDFVISTSDTQAPVLTEVTPIPASSIVNTPYYTFNTTEEGTIIYGGGCHCYTTRARSGDNRIKFFALADGSYSDCTIAIRDAAGNTSSPLTISAFSINSDQTFPFPEGYDGPYLRFLPTVYNRVRPGIPGIGQIGTPGNFFTPDWSTLQTPETFRETFDYWFNYEASDPDFIGRMDLSTNTHNASLMYYEAYMIDAAIDAWEGLNDIQYLDKGLEFVEDRLANQYDYAARAALSLNAVEDNVPRMGWVGANVTETGIVNYAGEEVQAENQWMMSVARLLFKMNNDPAVMANAEYQTKYASILYSAEELYKKWYYRTTPYGRNFHSLGNQHDLWERVLVGMMFIKELTQDQEVIDLIDDVTNVMEVDGITVSGVYRRLKTQLLTATHPVTGGIFWEDEWGNFATGLGDDLSHANLALAYIPEAVVLEKNDWTMSHISGLRDLWSHLYDPNTGYTRRHLNASTHTSSNFSAYWLNLGRKLNASDTGAEAVALVNQKLRPWISNYYALHYAKIILANSTHFEQEADTASPVFDNANLADITAVCELTSLTPPTATDNVSGVIQGVTDASLPITSNTTISWTYEDAAGNTSTQNQNIIITDDENPQIADCPANINTTVTGENCNVVVGWTPPTASDNCQLESFIASHNPGDNFPSGATTVTYSATDKAGNINTCDFIVNISGSSSDAELASSIVTDGFSLSAGESRDLVFLIENIGTSPTSEPVSFLISLPGALSASVSTNGDATSAFVYGGSVSVNNQDWTFNNLGSSIQCTTKAGVNIPSNAHSAIVINVTAVGAVGSTFGISGVIISNSGGDVRESNNNAQGSFLIN